MHGNVGSDTPSRVKFLKALPPEKFTMLEASIKLGVTKNVVVGLARRFGLKFKLGSTGGLRVKGQKAAASKAKPVNHVRVEVGAIRKARKKSLGDRRTQPMPQEPLHLPDAFLGVGKVTLVQLEAKHCRWPLGEAPYTFCGDDRLSEGPYCAKHATIARRCV